MAPKRKAPTNPESSSTNKRQKLDTELMRYPCQLCTSTASAGDILAIRATTKGKPAQDLTAHKKCMDVIPELDWKKEKIYKGDLPRYKSRFKLKCDVCSESHGAKIQCSITKCTNAFHINCATLAEDVLFDTTTETYGLFPWYLLCKRHNAERIRKSASMVLPSPVSSDRALSASPPLSSTGSVDGMDHEDSTVSGPMKTAMLTPPETTTGSPILAASPSKVNTPYSPASMMQDFAKDSSAVDEEIAHAVDEVLEEAASPLNPVLTPEQIKLVSDFMFTDPTWDLFMQGMVAPYEPSSSTLV